jgi:Carboxypeptidase regulatory-like domain
MKANIVLRLGLCLTMLFGSTAFAAAQETTGSISGTITDPSGAAIRGAAVVLTNTDRGQDVRILKTDSSGSYTGASLPLGTYTVKVSDSGFKTEVVTGLVLHASDALTMNRTLVVGNVAETVTVSADQVQLNLENGMSQGLINGTQIRELALNNRNYEQLLVLQPGVSYGGASDQLYIGVSLPSGTSAQVAFSINGSRPTSNNWTIDGSDNVDRGANLTLLAYPSVDAIAEFKTLRGTYLAEYGRNASGQINVVTRSGTNSLHGSAYEFFRNDLFNANSWANKLTPGIPTARPKLRYNDFGYTIGGPVRIPHVYNGTDKTFFFWSQEFRRVITYVSVSPQVPTAAERNGDFTQSYNGKSPTAPNPTVVGPSAVSVCTAYTQTTTTSACTAWGSTITNISPTAKAYLKDIFANIPLPPSAADLAAGLDPHTYTYNQRNVFNDTQELARIDHSFSSRLNLFYRYLHDSLPSTEPGGLFNGSTLPGVSVSNTRAPGTQHLVHATYNFTPTLLMDLGYAYSSGAVISSPAGTSASINAPDIKPTLPFSTQNSQFSTSLGVVPSLSITNLSGISNAGIYNDYDVNHNIFGDVTKVLGRHNFKVGFTYNRYEKTENATGAQQGSFAFSSTGFLPTVAQLAPGTNIPSTTDAAIANFLLGNANNGFSQASASLTPDIHQNLYEAYVQDDWKLNPRLTLNLGVRYSFFAQPTDSNGLLSSFDASTYVAANAQTVASNGLLCVTGSACQNANGLNSGTANPNGDFINGVILGAPGNFKHPSPFGEKVATAQKNNIAPRLGFAYDLFGDGKTALRGGYGIAYEQSQVNIYETPAFDNFPFVNSLSLPVATFDNPAGGTASIATALPSVHGFSNNYKTPYTMQYSLDVQNAITSSLSLDVGYFGSMSRHLQGVVDLNTLRPGAFLTKGLSQYAICPPTGFIATTCEQQLNQIRPYPGYLNVSDVETIFSANYNGLQVKAYKKFSGNSYIDANYTWSRALTNAINDYSTAPQNVYNINGDYGRAVYDRTNILTFDGVFELPWYRDQQGLVGHVVGGWEISGLYVVDSGLPLTVTLSSGGGTICYACTATGGGAVQTSVLGRTDGGQINDSAGLGIMNSPDPASLRPNMVLNPNSGYGQKIHTRQNWFYRPAFVAPGPNDIQVGNEKRGVIEGPGFNRLDVGLFRNFKIREALEFQLRGEAFNTLNHTNLQSPSVAGASSAFGTITSARDNRILQVAGKFTF